MEIVKAFFVAWFVAGSRIQGFEPAVSEWWWGRHLKRIMQRDSRQAPIIEFKMEPELALKASDQFAAQIPAKKIHSGQVSRDIALVAIAIVVAGVLCAVAILIGLRWEIATASGGDVYLLDRVSGEISECNSPNAVRLAARGLGVGAKYRCTPLSSAETERILLGANKLPPVQQPQYVGLPSGFVLDQTPQQESLQGSWDKFPAVKQNANDGPWAAYPAVSPDKRMPPDSPSLAPIDRNSKPH